VEKVFDRKLEAMPDTKSVTLVGANDVFRATFEQIADMIGMYFELEEEDVA